MKLRHIFTIVLITITASQIIFAQEDSESWEISNRIIPPPTCASEKLYQSIASTPQPDREAVQVIPENPEQWKVFQQQRDAVAANKATQLAEAISIKVTEKQMAGVTVRLIEPAELDKSFSNALFIHIHGGAYILNAGEAGIIEAILIVHRIKIPVLSVDYRMPPDHPFPAALDDAVAVYEQVLQDYPDHTIFLGGTSAGGGLSMATILKLKEKGLKLPNALFAGTPWTDLTKTGDSYYIMDGIDRLLICYEGILEGGAKLYANGQDLKEPLISPVYGDLSGFPPTMLVSGTRDLFLSNTVRAHRKLRNSGVKTDLVVIEGLSHGDYLFAAESQESLDVFSDLSHFLSVHMSKDK